MSESGAKSPPATTNELEGLGGGNVKDSLIGVLLDARYEIVSPLGAGATGTVYKARDILLMRCVAVKIMHQELLSSPAAVERFKSEAVTSTELNHPNIARVYTQGVASNGHIFMVMDLLEGESLSSYLSREGKLSLDACFDLFLPIMDAIDYAHSHHVIHRDIKPGNIILAVDSGVKKPMLVDFGLAKCTIKTSLQGLTQTQTAALLGSSAYMSPEQCLGLDDVDARADIYSLGCVMLESLVGKAPFQGESALEVMYKHLNESLAGMGFLQELPESIAKIFEKCLKKERQERYQSMSELRRDFACCAEMRDTLQRRWQQKKKVAERKALWPVGLSLFLIFAGVLSLAWFLKTRSPALPSQLGSENKKTNDALPPPSLARVPLNEGDLARVLDKYSKDGPLAQIEILKHWQSKHNKVAPPEAQAFVYYNFVKCYVQMQQVENAEYYADKVYKCKLAKPSLAATCSLCNLYAQLDQPEKGWATIEKILRQGVSDFQLSDQIEFYWRQARCLMQMHAYKDAVSLLKHVRQLSLQNAEMRRDIGYSGTWRTLLIEALYRSGQKSQAPEVISECEFAARASDSASAMADAHWDIAFTFARLGELELQQEYLERAKQEYLKQKLPERAEDCNLQIEGTCIGLKQYNRALIMEKESLGHASAWMRRVDILQGMSSNAARLNDRKAAYAYLQEALDICWQHLQNSNSKIVGSGADHGFSAVCGYFDLLKEDKKTDEIEELLDDWISRMKTREGDLPLLARFYLLKGEFLNQGGHHEQAREFALGALAIFSKPEVQKFYEKNKANVSTLQADCYALESDIFLGLSKPAESLEAIKKALALLNGQRGTGHKAMEMYFRLARILNHLEQVDEAAKYYDRAESIWRKVYINWNLEDAMELAEIARFRFETQHDYEGAEKLCKDCIVGLTAHYKNRSELAWFETELGDSLVNQNKFGSAIAPLKEAVSICRRAGKKDYDHKHALHQLWNVSLKMHDYANAEKYAKDFIEICQPNERSGVYILLDQVYAAQNKDDKRAACLEKALHEFKLLPEYSRENLFTIQLDLGRVYMKEHRFTLADTVITASVQTATRIHDSLEEPAETARAKSNLANSNLALADSYRELANCQVQEGKFREADLSFTESTKYFERIATKGGELKSTLSQWLVASKLAKNDKRTAELELRLRNLNTN